MRTMDYVGKHCANWFYTMVRKNKIKRSLISKTREFELQKLLEILGRGVPPGSPNP